MVASVLKAGRMFGWRVGLLVLFWSAVGASPSLGGSRGENHYSLPVRQSAFGASSSLGGRLIEEDLPPEPVQMESPTLPHAESTPVLPEPVRIQTPVIGPLEPVPTVSRPVSTPLSVGLPPESLPSLPQSSMEGSLPFVGEEALSGVTNAPPPLPIAETLSPKEVVALRFVEEGKAAVEQGDVNRARVQFERAMSVAPLQPYSYYFLGELAFGRGEHQQALAFLQRAELLFAPKDQAWRGETAGLKGTVYEDLGDYAQARAAYQRCLRLTPSHLKALSAVARLSVEESLPSDTPPQ